MNSSELRGYLTGLILGDGFIGKGVTKRSFAIKSINKEFINKIKDDIESCSDFEMRVIYTPAHFSSGCNHKDSWELQIKSHPYFNKKYHHFYDDYRKRIASKEALSWLTPQGLANWYMSDGYVCLVGKTKGQITSRRIDFCTDRYSKETIVEMQKTFLHKFGIQTSIIKRDKFYRIRVASGSYETFINLIYPYVINSMKYKLYLAYDFQPKWMRDKMWKCQESVRSAIAQPDNAVG